MGGPPWECLPKKLANGRIIYRCLYGHFHSYAGAAWSCGGPHDKSTDPCTCGVAWGTAEGPCVCEPQPSDSDPT